MQKESKIFDDFAKVINGVAGTVAGMGREAQDNMRERTKEFVSGMDFVSREEFEAVKQMAAKARSEVDALSKRLEALEGKKPAAKKAPAKTKTTRARKAPVKKAVAKKTPAKSARKTTAKKKAAPKKAASKR